MADAIRIAPEAVRKKVISGAALLVCASLPLYPVRY